MRKIIFTVMLLAIQSTAYCQSTDDLQSINRKAKVLYVTPDALDRLLIDLRKFENPVDHNQDTLVLDTYDAIASGYMANNHFKRAYEVYEKYIFRKEEMLYADKVKSISNLNNSSAGKEQVNDRKVKELQLRLSELQNDNESLISSRQSFKRYFSFALILLTGIFAVMLVTAGIQMMNIRTSLQKNRERIKVIHRLALIGNYSKGLKMFFKESIQKINELLKELQQMIKKQDQGTTKQITQTLSGVDKICQETLNKI